MAYDKVVDSAVLDAGLKQIADAIREKGGTSDNLAFPAAMADAIAAIETGGNSSATTYGAFENIPAHHSDGSAIQKSVVSLPEQFRYSYAHAQAETVTCSLEGCESGDTCAAVVAIRGSDNPPIVSAGWELVSWNPPNPSDDTVKQGAAVYQRTVQSGETSASITVEQPGKSDRVYCIVLNIKDCAIENHEEHHTIRRVTEYDDIRIPYENTLMICSVSLANTGTSAPDVWWCGLCHESILPNFNDGVPAGSRLCVKFIPCSSMHGSECVAHIASRKTAASTGLQYRCYTLLGLTLGTKKRYACGHNGILTAWPIS